MLDALSPVSLWVLLAACFEWLACVDGFCVEVTFGGHARFREGGIVCEGNFSEDTVVLEVGFLPGGVGGSLGLVSGGTLGEAEVASSPRVSRS